MFQQWGGEEEVQEEVEVHRGRLSDGRAEDRGGGGYSVHRQTYRMAVQVGRPPIVQGSQVIQENFNS